MRYYHAGTGYWYDDFGYVYAGEFGGSRLGHHSNFGFNPFSGDIDLDLGGGIGLDLNTGELEFDGFDIGF